ncbi:MAG: MFS transporter [Phycisphaerae bacterium]|nr:MFS transporter [Phycisphaerae bacterium]
MTEPPARRAGLGILGWFKTRPDLPTIADRAAVKEAYSISRWTTFTAVTVGYSFFYFTRLTLSVAKKPMVDAGVANAQDLGAIGMAFFIAYAFGRLVNGFLCDRAHIGRFMGFGLLVSAIINVVFGWRYPVIIFILLWCMNGWFQSMGSAPSVSNMAAWFSRKERGVRYSVWSLAHNLGEGMTFVVTAVVVGAFGWQVGFWAPGLICIVVAVILFKTILDRPETYGLPPIAEYKGEAPDPRDDDGKSIGHGQLHVLSNPAIWVLGLASACMYVARYGINNWFVFYLQEAKGLASGTAGFSTAFYPFIGALGTLSAGPISDYVFGGRRIPVCLLYGLLLIAGLVAIPLIPRDHLWADRGALSVCGFAIGGLLVFLGGLVAVDISSKRAAGAAMGVIGVFSYLGAALGDYVGGWLIESSKVVVDDVTTYDFRGLLTFWIGAGVLSFVLTLSLWRPWRREAN